MIHKKYLYIFLVLSLVVTSSCSKPMTTLKKTMQVIGNPDIRVGELKDQPTMVSISIVAADDINPNPFTSIENIESITEQKQDPAPALKQEQVSDAKQNLIQVSESNPVSGIVSDSKQAADLASEAEKVSGLVSEPKQILEPGQGISLLGEESYVNKEELINLGIVSDSNQAADLALESEKVSGLVSEPKQILAPEPGVSLLDEEAYVNKKELITLLDKYQNQLLDKIALMFSANSPGTAPGTLQETATVKGETTPLKIIVFQLTDTSVFNSLDYDSLFKDPEKSLGKSYVESQEYIIEPGQFKYIDSFPVEEETRYLALAAFFSKYDTAVWKSSLKIIPKGEQYPMAITLQGNRACLKKDH